MKPEIEAVFLDVDKEALRREAPAVSLNARESDEGKRS